MKKIICVVLALVCAISLVACATPANTDTYTKTGCKVYDVHKYGDEVAIIDEAMDIWTFVDADFDAPIGDECVLVMHNNGTPNDIYDDIILEIK